jgi:hypothetical protein
MRVLPERILDPCLDQRLIGNLTLHPGNPRWACQSAAPCVRREA